MLGPLPVIPSTVITTLPSTVTGVRAVHAIAIDGNAAGILRLRDTDASGDELWRQSMPLGASRQTPGPIMVPSGTLYVEKIGIAALDRVSIAYIPTSASVSPTGLS